MPLLPNASVKTKYDFTRGRFEWKRQFQVAPTLNAVEEGTVLMRTEYAGEEVVDAAITAAFAGAQAFAGIALNSRITAYSFTKVVNVVVPSVAPYTVQVDANLVDSGLGVAELFAVNAAGTKKTGGALTLVAGLVALDDEVAADVSSGIVTFHSGEAGEAFTIQYKWLPTAVERDLLLRQSHVNRGAEDQFGLLTVGYGNCWVYTTMYDAQQEYAVGSPVYTKDGGYFTSEGLNNQVGRVISVPSPGDPFLGVEYDTGTAL